MRDDFIGGIAVVQNRLEDLYAFAGDFGAAQPANELLALAENMGPQTTSIHPMWPVTIHNVTKLSE